MELADRVAVMERGRVAQFDTPAALLAEPSTAFVAGFVGEAARLDGRVDHGVLRFPLPGLPPLRVDLPDGPATAFVRPRDVAVGPASEGQGAGGASIRLLRATAEGETRAVVALGDAATLDAMVPAVGGTPDWPSRGAACRVHLAAAQVFGADGRRGSAVPLVMAAPVSMRR